jgi:hypothetical protein
MREGAFEFCYMCVISLTTILCFSAETSSYVKTQIAVAISTRSVKDVQNS